MKHDLRRIFTGAIRSADAGDAASLLRLEQACFGATAKTPGDIHAHLRDPDAESRLALSDKQDSYAGYALGDSHGTLGRIFRLAVVPDARGHGYGRVLLDDICARLHERGADRIQLQVRTGNHSAIALYESSGFSVAEHLPGFYGEGQDAYRMEKQYPPHRRPRHGR